MNHGQSARVWLASFLAGLLPSLALQAAPAIGTPAERPNIVLILADDLGQGDLGCYDSASKVPTPNLDRLAASGTRFTTAYCPVAICSPTRYGLMTGAYPWRSWKKSGVLANWERPMIKDDQLTLPALLRRTGYTTAGFGKWHLGARYPTLDGKPPAGQGAFKARKSGANIDLKAPISGGPLDRGFDRWKGFICASELLIFDGNLACAQLAHDLYPPMEMPGAPQLESIPLAAFLPRVTEWSIEFLRQRIAESHGKPFFLYFAPYVPHAPLAVEKRFIGSTRGGEYGDYVHELDHYIGQILDELKKGGLDRNTLVLFASDNGSQWTRTGKDHRPNGRLRGTKHQVFEGGVRTPFIASWPGHIPAGATRADLLALTDLFATLAAAAGADLPAGDDVAPDSFNQWPALLGQTAESVRQDVLLHSGSHDSGLREGPWKIVQRSGKQALFHLGDDPAEEVNLAAKEPERTARMVERLRELLAAPRTAPAGK